jgi:predicted dienelactone hydrolase
MGAGDEGVRQAESLAVLSERPPWVSAHLARGRSGVLAAETAAPLPGPFPVVIYSHGFGGNAQIATLVLRELASHGIIVVAVEHTGACARRR